MSTLAVELAERGMVPPTRRAQLEDGQRVLDLGCGWGSFSLHIAREMPASSVLALSNSRPGGKFFVHVFAHRERLYPFGHEGQDEWMGRHFFTGGVMPSVALLPRAAEGSLELEEQWWVDGSHYQRTAEHWLQKHEAARDEVLAIFRTVYGPADAERWYHRWRLFYLACAELFGYAGGREWGVAHYRFAAPGGS